MFNRAPGIGIDIGSKKIKVVQIKKKKQSMEIIQFNSMLTPAGIIEGGIINDPQLLGEVMAPIVKELKLNGKQAVSAVSGQQVYTRNIIMPVMPFAELREAVQFQAMSFLPIPVEEAVMDIFPLRDFEDEEGKKTEVFFVAVRKQQVEALDTACKIAGLNLTAVEIEPIAINRALSPLCDYDIQAYLNIGAFRSFFAVFQNGMMIFYRNLSFGISAFYKLTDMGEDANLEPGIKGEQQNDYDNLIQDIISEMARSLEYFEIQNRDSGDKVNKILICGGGSRIKQIEESLSSGIGRKFEISDTLANFHLSADVGQEAYNELRYDFTLALGLAARADK